MISPDDGDAQWMAANRKELDGLEAEIARCKEIAERDGKDYAELSQKYQAALLQLREAEKEMDRLRTLSEADPALVHALTKERDAANRLNEGLRNALVKMVKQYSAETFCDVDCGKNALCEYCTLEREVVGLIEKPKCAVCGRQSLLPQRADGTCLHCEPTEKRVDAVAPRRGCVDFGHKGPIEHGVTGSGISVTICQNCKENV